MAHQFGIHHVSIVRPLCQGIYRRCVDRSIVKRATGVGRLGRMSTFKLPLVRRVSNPRLRGQYVDSRSIHAAPYQTNFSRCANRSRALAKLKSCMLGRATACSELSSGPHMMKVSRLMPSRLRRLKQRLMACRNSRSCIRCTAVDRHRAERTRPLRRFRSAEAWSPGCARARIAALADPCQLRSDEFGGLASPNICVWYLQEWGVSAFCDGGPLCCFVA